MKTRLGKSGLKFTTPLVIAGALILAGCGGSDAPQAPPTIDDTPSAYEVALGKIKAAETAEDAQAAYDDVKNEVTASDGEKLQAAVDARQKYLRAENQKAKLAEAAMAVDTSDLSDADKIAAAKTAIATLQAALDKAVDVSAADKAMYVSRLEAANTAVGTAQDDLDTQGLIAMQKKAMTTAAGNVDTTGLTTRDAITDAEIAIAALQSAIDDAVNVSAADKAMYESQVTDANADVARATDRLDISDAISAAETAVGLVNDDSTDAIVDAADDAISNAESVIADATNVPAGEKAANSNTVSALDNRLDAAKVSRQDAKDKADQDAKDKQAVADKAMAALAAKLYDGIGASPLANHVVTIASVTGIPTVDVNGSGTEPAAQALTEDKKTVVADNHGWKGKRYTAAPTGGTYEAVIYSNIGDPTPGAKFSAEYSDNLTNGVLNTTTTEGTPSRVDSTSFGQSPGVKSFKSVLLSGNTIGVEKSGTYHGVSGTYTCVVTGDNVCAVRPAATGFTLGGLTDATDASTFSGDNAAWTFEPSSLDTLVMSTDDNIYASYGHWLRTATNGDLAASAFAVDRGTVEKAPDNLHTTLLAGTATYKGGAAGKYALRSSTGGTNDAGDFTAAATLDAVFSGATSTISGTIDTFMGADGKSRDWSVELKEADISNEGAITRTGTGELNNDTAWTIGGTAASDSGEWSGNLKKVGADGVPTIGTGVFSSTYGSDGRMVGGFGVSRP